jgi:hypothetical protein
MGVVAGAEDTITFMGSGVGTAAAVATDIDLPILGIPARGLVLHLIPSLPLLLVP